MDDDVNCSLIKFLTDGTLGQVRLGISRVEVVRLLGGPFGWEGKPQWTATESNIWVYGPLQINFDNNSAIEALRFHFHHHISQGLATLQKDFSPFALAESLDDRFAEIIGFERFLTDHDVAFSRSRNEIGQSVVQTKAAVTRFTKRTDYGASSAANKSITIPGELIVSSSVPDSAYPLNPFGHAFGSCAHGRGIG
jgi:hypothetical protein